VFYFASQEKGGKFLTTDFVYATFFSLAGCPLNVVVSFPHTDEKPRTTRVGKQDPQLQSIDEDLGKGQQPSDIKEIEASLEGNLS
jgi:hypothetical protein